MTRFFVLIALIVVVLAGSPLLVVAGSPFADDTLQPEQTGQGGESGSRFEPVPPDEAPATVGTPETLAPKPPKLLPPPEPGRKGVTAGSKEFPKWFSAALAKADDWGFPTVVNRYGQTITSEDFFKAIIWIESNGVMKHTNGTMVTSCVGALGFSQLMPATAKGLGVNPRDPAQNLKGGVLLLNQIFQVGAVKQAQGEEKLIKAVVAYNAGPYSKLLKKSWADLQKGKAREPIGYGLKLKMCLGLELTAPERQLVSKMFGVKLAKVDAFATNEFYSPANGLL